MSRRQISTKLVVLPRLDAMSPYISYETERLRLILIEIGFYAEKLTAREDQIVYVHEATGKKVYIPKCKRLAKRDAEQIMDRVANIVGKYELLQASLRVDKRT